MRALLALLAASLLLAACGRVGPPRPPGPRSAITYPRVYPAPTAEDRALAQERTRALQEYLSTPAGREEYLRANPGAVLPALPAAP
ncbi:hypothetical protein EJV46_18485 [Roseococcus sp. SYP-B2431]|uniref:hypothetical protein n=1 Tax=Roseococcus sp. SYP-B2431 TaxID=2496640 RepID=UPI00103BD096|nr:hypothetical protein EJV46_18485 [Roseococcus sp. SYP-B2431]